MKNQQKPYIIDLTKINDPRGNLSFLQDFDQLPFAMERCYWLYDVPGNASRDGHAYHTSQEVIIALSGSFDVVLDDVVARARQFLHKLRGDGNLINTILSRRLYP